MPDRHVPIALLSQVGESGRHLREALISAGTPIVYEANAAELDRDALDASGARVVVVNLDGDVDAQLDEVYALLGDDRYSVIFNEAQVSSQLSGWEQARWARHLAAKILGTEDADPPRPEGAEPVPVKARAPLEAGPERAVASDGRHLDAVVADDSGEELSVPAPAKFDFSGEFALEEAAAQGSDDFASGFASESGDARGTAPAAADAVEFFDLSTATDTDDVIVVGSDATDIGALGFGDLDDFAGDDIGESADFAFAEPSTPKVPRAETSFELELDPVSDAPAVDAPLDPASELAASAAAIERAAAPGGLAELELLDLDWADAPAAPAREDEPEVALAPPPQVSREAFSWTLSDVEEGDGQAAPEPPPPGSKATFGIETISAAEYLAHDSEEEAVVEAEESSLFSLELVPLEEAVAPQSRTDTPAHENWMEAGAGKVAVRKVWVLGASIGGPEAVREFLARIPKDYPALFLLAQHMGAEFVDLMAQQLAKTTTLTVRMPTHGERVGDGDIVIVPIDRRLRVDSEGIIVLEPLGDARPPHSPSIDQLLIDVADRFGAKAGAIVFSGMAEDAAEGSRHLVAKGGRVYVQDPETCVISSMVDGVLETGVVSFTGSPNELADRVLAERSTSSAGK